MALDAALDVFALARNARQFVKTLLDSSNTVIVFGDNGEKCVATNCRRLSTAATVDPVFGLTKWAAGMSVLFATPVRMRALPTRWT